MEDQEQAQDEQVVEEAALLEPEAKPTPPPRARDWDPLTVPQSKPTAECIR